MSPSPKGLAASILERTRSAGDDLREGLETLRCRIRDLQARRAEIDSLPPAFAEIEERVDRWIERMQHHAEENSPSASWFLAGPSHYQQPSTLRREETMVALLAPLLAEEMKRKLRLLYEARPGLEASDRADQLKQIDRNLLDAEMAEESIIRAAESAGFKIFRRSNADPRAVLAHHKALP